MTSRFSGADVDRKADFGGHVAMCLADPAGTSKLGSVAKIGATKTGHCANPSQQRPAVVELRAGHGPSPKSASYQQPRRATPPTNAPRKQKGRQRVQANPCPPITPCGATEVAQVAQPGHRPRPPFTRRARVPKRLSRYGCKNVSGMIKSEQR